MTDKQNLSAQKLFKVSLIVLATILLIICFFQKV